MTTHLPRSPGPLEPLYGSEEDIDAAIFSPTQTSSESESDSSLFSLDAYASAMLVAVTSAAASGGVNDTGSWTSHLDPNISVQHRHATPNAWTAGLMAEYLVRLVFAVLMILVNTLVLVTLGTTRSLRGCATNLVIGSLAVTDLMVGVMSPAGLLIELQLVVQPILCKLGYAGVMALSSVSINHLLFVSVDRYLMITRPLRYKSFITKRKVWAFIAACWLWGTAIAVPFVFDLTIQASWLEESGGECRAELMLPLGFLVVLFALHFVLPILVMFYVYGVIFRVASRQRQAIQESFRITNRYVDVRRRDNIGKEGIGDSLRVTATRNAINAVVGRDPVGAEEVCQGHADAYKNVVTDNGVIASAVRLQEAGGLAGSVSRGEDEPCSGDDAEATTAVATPAPVSPTRETESDADSGEEACSVADRIDIELAGGDVNDKDDVVYEQNSQKQSCSEERSLNNTPEQNHGGGFGNEGNGTVSRNGGGHEMRRHSDSLRVDTREIILQRLSLRRGSLELIPAAKQVRSDSVQSDTKVMKLLKEDKNEYRSNSVQSDTWLKTARRLNKGRGGSLTSLFRTTHRAMSANKRAKLRSARLLVLPCGFFYLTWGPWFGLILWAVATGSVVEPHGLERLLQAICMLNSLGNPVLYAITQPQLGRAMLKKVAVWWTACRDRCVETVKVNRERGLYSSHADDTVLVRSPVLPDEHQSEV